MKRSLVTFHHLKDYAAFILNNHIDEFVKVDIERSREVELPLLKLFDSLPEEALIQLSKKGNIEFFESIIHDRAIDKAIQGNQDWRADKVPGIRRDQVVASDIALIYNVKKNSLLHFLTRYTSDTEKMIAIIREIEAFYTFQESLAIRTFAEINKEELTKRETRLKEAQGLANLGYWDYDFENNQVTWSDELYHIYGLDKNIPIQSEIIAKHIHKEDVAILMDKVKDIYQNGGTYTQEYRIINTHGETRTLVDKGYVEKHSDGKITVKGISQDITDRKKAEEELSHREELLREAQALAHLGSWEWDTVKNEVHWSDEMYRLFGFAPNEVKVDYEQYLGLLHPEDKDMVNTIVYDCYQNKKAYSFEHRLILKDGSIRWLESRGQVTKSEGDKVLMIAGTAMDITARKEAKERIKKNEALLLETQEIANIGSYDWDIQNDISVITPEVKRIFGYGQEEDATFTMFSELLHEEDRERVTNAMTKAFQTGEPYLSEYRIYRKNDQQLRYVWTKGKISYDKNGKPSRLIGSVMDITDRKLIEEALKHRQTALEASNKELEAFCYTISHDLRSPLRAIDGFGRKLAKQYGEQLDQEGQRLLNVVRENAQQMGVLIDCLLDFSRLNRKIISKGKFEMEQLVSKVVEECRQQNPNHTAKITIGEMENAEGDRDLLHQVWHNLISNAIKFTSKAANPTIEIGSEIKKDEIVYYIKDNGVGFDMDYKDKLFGVFQRLHSLDDFSGTGVGLATVQRIIHRHGGNVWAEGEEKKGATFYFSLLAGQEVNQKEVYL